MALRKNYRKVQKHFDGFLEISNAYCRVESVNASKTKAQFNVSFSKEQDGEFVNIDQQSYFFIPKLDGQNFIAQAYAHLKTLPEFEGATDC
jgi:hypothetical protein